MSRLRKASRRFLHDDDEDGLDDSHVMDEEEQQQLLAFLQSRANRQDDIFKQAFVVLMLLPTPLYLILPYYRHNSILSLLSLTSITISAYSLHYLRPQFALLSTALGLIVAGSGYWEHWPWRGFEWLWCLPVLSGGCAVVVRRWMDQTMTDLRDLSKSAYGLKGA